MFVVSELHAVNISGNDSSVFLGALVVPTEVLGELLMVVEHMVGDTIFPNDRVRPQLLHEEHLIGEVGGGA